MTNTIEINEFGLSEHYSKGKRRSIGEYTATMLVEELTLLR